MNHTHTHIIPVKPVPVSTESVPSLAQTTCPYCGVGCGVDITMQQEAGNTVLTSLTGRCISPAFRCRGR